MSLSKIQFFCLLLPASTSLQPVACANPQPSFPPSHRLPELLPLSWLPDVSCTSCAQGMLNFTSPSIPGAGSRIPVAWSSKGEFCMGLGELKN